MARYKLLTGQHAAADKSRPILGPDGKPIPGRFERRTYNAGELIESDRDLATAEPQRYEAVGAHANTARIAELEAEVARLKAGAVGVGTRTPGDPTPQVASGSPSVAPGGQVSTGFQATSGGRGGPMLPDEAVKHGAQGGQGEGQPLPHAQHAPADDLDSLNLTELRAKAEEEEIDLPSGYVKKEELIQRLRAAKRAK